MATVKDVLVKARAVIAEPEHWCKGWYSKDKNGDATDAVYDARAFSFCSLGAIRKALFVEGIRPLSAEFNEMRDEAVAVLALCEDPDTACIEDTVINFNDSHQHEDVLKAFDCAISKLEE